jgi:hypothetical protein
MEVNNGNDFGSNPGKDEKTSGASGRFDCKGIG